MFPLPPRPDGFSCSDDEDGDNSDDDDESREDNSDGSEEADFKGDAESSVESGRVKRKAALEAKRLLSGGERREEVVLNRPLKRGGNKVEESDCSDSDSEESEGFSVKKTQMAADGWIFSNSDEGRGLMGSSMRRFFTGHPYSEGKVVAFLSKEKNDNTEPLWHIIHDDGDEEDLDWEEVQTARYCHLKDIKRRLTKAQSLKALSEIDSGLFLIDEKNPLPLEAMDLSDDGVEEVKEAPQNKAEVFDSDFDVDDSDDEDVVAPAKSRTSRKCAVIDIGDDDDDQEEEEVGVTLEKNENDDDDHDERRDGAEVGSEESDPFIEELENRESKEFESDEDDSSSDEASSESGSDDDFEDNDSNGGRFAKQKKRKILVKGRQPKKPKAKRSRVIEIEDEVEGVKAVNHKASQQKPSSTSRKSPEVIVDIVEAAANEVKRINYTKALEWRKTFLQRIKALKLPENPLDLLIHELGGVHKVAELTGRKGRLVKSSSGKVRYKLRGESNGLSLEKQNLYEKDAFMSGDKRVAILSEAASSGISLQADKRVENQQRRVHITIELSWSADKTIQVLCEYIKIVTLLLIRLFMFRYLSATGANSSK